MSEIIKTKFLCKNGSRTAPRAPLGSIKWKDRFIEGKWYDGEYETWAWEDGYRVNGGWRKYWVINERGEKEEISKAHMKAIFEFDIQQLREEKLKDILN
jgi:hypothetical protein